MNSEGLWKDVCFYSLLSTLRGRARRVICDLEPMQEKAVFHFPGSWALGCRGNFRRVFPAKQGYPVWDPGGRGSLTPRQWGPFQVNTKTQLCSVDFFLDLSAWLTVTTEPNVSVCEVRHTLSEFCLGSATFLAAAVEWITATVKLICCNC